jgi:hypothetical protein
MAAMGRRVRREQATLRREQWDESIGGSSVRAYGEYTIGPVYST